jgi:hypothetical protein
MHYSIRRDMVHSVADAQRTLSAFSVQGGGWPAISEYRIFQMGLAQKMNSE